MNEPRLRTIVPNPEKWKRVKSILEDFATGNYTLTAIQKKLAAMGIFSGQGEKRLHLSSISNFLSNPFYYGVFRYRGELHEGSHQPMITKECFDNIQRALVTVGKPHSRNKRGPKNFQFLGFARCSHCGHCITAERKIKKSGLRYLYYRCTHKNKILHCEERSFMREERLAEEIKRNVQLVCLPDEWKEKFLAKLELIESEGAVDGSKLNQRLTAGLTTVKAKIQRLMALYVDGGLDLTEFKTMKNAMVEEKVSIEQKLELEARRGNRLEPIRNWILEANQANSVGFGDNYGEMAAFLKQVGSKRLLRAGNLCVEFIKPWNSLAEITLAARSADTISAQHLKWWRRRELNPRPKLANWPRLHA